MGDMGKPWFGPVAPVFVVFPITWQGWALVVGSQVLIVAIRLFVPEFFASPDKGEATASTLALLLEAAYFVIVIWKVGSRRRRATRSGGKT